MFKIESPKIKKTIVIEFNRDKESYYYNIFSNIIFEDLNYKIDFNSCVFDNVDFNNKRLDSFVFYNCLFNNCDFSNSNFDNAGFNR